MLNKEKRSMKYNLSKALVKTDQWKRRQELHAKGISLFNVAMHIIPYKDIARVN